MNDNTIRVGDTVQVKPGYCDWSAVNNPCSCVIPEDEGSVGVVTRMFFDDLACWANVTPDSILILVVPVQFLKLVEPAS